MKKWIKFHIEYIYHAKQNVHQTNNQYLLINTFYTQPPTAKSNTANWSLMLAMGTFCSVLLQARHAGADRTQFSKTGRFPNVECTDDVFTPNLGGYYANAMSQC